MNDQSKPRVLLVGHCMPDAYRLKSAIERFVPDAVVAMIGNSDELDAAVADTAAPAADLILVNRVLDGYFRAAGGIPLIRELAGVLPQPAPALMLISDLPDAQREAEAAGALPGLGKSDLYSDEARSRITSALKI